MPRLKHITPDLFGYGREETPGEVIFFRLFEAFIALGAAYLAWSWGFYTLRISEVVLPLGIAQYVDLSFLYGNRLPLLSAGLITGLLAAGFFRLHRYAYAGALALLVVQYAARFALGEIPHSSNMLGMTLLGLALATVAFPEGRYRRRFTLGFTYFFVGLGYTSAAICKLIATGPLWVDGRHLWMWIHEKSIDMFAAGGALELNLLQQLALDHYPVATLFLAVGLLSEFFAFLMWWPRLRYPVVLAVLGLHMGIFVVMDIMFTLAVVQLVLMGLPWARWIDHGLERWAPRSLSAPGGGLLRGLAPRGGEEVRSG